MPVLVLLVVVVLLLSYCIAELNANAGVWSCTFVAPDSNCVVFVVVLVALIHMCIGPHTEPELR